MKKLLLLYILLCLSCIDGHAQNFDEKKLETLTNEFIQEANSPDVLSIMTKIKRYYGALSKNDKTKVRSYYIDKITSLLENEQKDKVLVVISLYQKIVNYKDEKLPALLYIKGNIYAEKMDSINLGETIKELNNTDLKQSSSLTNYISYLNEKMEKIRNYTPSYKKVNGVWIADGLFWDKGKKNRINHKINLCGPDIMLQVLYDSKADTLSFVIKPSNICNEITSEIWINALQKRPVWESSQLVIPYASDSIYVVWSNNIIDRNCPEIASILRGSVSATAAAVNAELAQKNKHSSSSQFFGKLATTFTEVALNSVLSAMFTPSKAMFVLEARLKIVNKHLMTGLLTFKYKYITADGSVLEDKDLKTNVTLSKWLPESNIVLSTNSLSKGHVWDPMISHSIDSLSYHERDIGFHNTRFDYCEKKIGKKVKLLSGNNSEGVKALRAYNNEQYKLLMLYNDSILKAQGYNGKLAIDDDVQPYIGIQYMRLDAKMQKKKKLTEGVIVNEVDKVGAAYVGGLKKGDIIVSVNDEMITNEYSMNKITSEMKIGDWLRMRVLRGKKELDLLIRVTWK